MSMASTYNLKLRPPEYWVQTTTDIPFFLYLMSCRGSFAIMFCFFLGHLADMFVVCFAGGRGRFYRKDQT